MEKKQHSSHHHVRWPPSWNCFEVKIQTSRLSWTIIYTRHGRFPGKLHHKITPNDYTTAEAKWRIFYLHFLHSPYMKTTLQSVRVGKNGWSVLKCISLLMRWKIRHARERCYYTPLVRRSPVMESSIIILNSFNGNFYFSNPARNNNPVCILVMQYKTLKQSLL